MKKKNDKSGGNMKSSKKVLPYIIYMIIILIFEVFLFKNYFYVDNFYLFLFAISFYIIGFFSINEYYKTKTFFSLQIIFNIFGILYTNYYIVQCMVDNIQISDNIYFSMTLSYVSILFFNLGYILSKSKNEENGIEKNYVEKDKKIYNKTMLIVLMIGLLIVSLGTEIYVIFYKIGFSAYTNASRAQQSKMMLDYSILSFYRSTIPLVSIVCLFIGLKYNNKFSRFVFIISFVISIVNATLSASRTDLLAILLPVLFLFNQFKKISNKTVIAIGIGGFILFGAWKGLVNGKTDVISYDSEFNTWYAICNNVLSDRFDFKYLYGKSYLKTIINLIVPVTNTTSLSTWYVKTYEYAVYNRGGGRGFSGVLEAYMNFGILGNILVYYFYGWLTKKIKRQDDLYIIIYMIVMTSIYQMFRSESYSLWKNMIWFKIFPIFIIFWIAGKKEKGKNVKKDIER